MTPLDLLSHLKKTKLCFTWFLYNFFSPSSLKNLQCLWNYLFFREYHETCGSSFLEDVHGTVLLRLWGSGDLAPEADRQWEALWCGCLAIPHPSRPGQPWHPRVAFPNQQKLSCMTFWALSVQDSTAGQEEA